MKTNTFVGIFNSDHAVLAAARAARKNGLAIRDAYTPFPVHGMDEALGLPPSWLSRACFALGATGLIGALSFQYWVSLFNWPMNIGGKPFDATPALIPITFEITVLVAGVGTVLTLLIFRGLIPGRRPEVQGLGSTDDKFLLVIEDAPEAELRAFFREHGAVDVAELKGGTR
ncbi:MAG: iron ABC transporter [Elusimicrobia bacterium CG11_big_fil_rev_8_21_14_0_20_64_6]|nr:MAG: iron ABC transporter [Elusimicrobia bacterium CG11_big_fil_rev_8_21_14_0_20_64_6]